MESQRRHEKDGTLALIIMWMYKGLPALVFHFIFPLVPWSSIIPILKIRKMRPREVAIANYSWSLVRVSRFSHQTKAAEMKMGVGWGWGGASKRPASGGHEDGQDRRKRMATRQGMLAFPERLQRARHCSKDFPSLPPLLFTLYRVN